MSYLQQLVRFYDVLFFVEAVFLLFIFDLFLSSAIIY